MKDYSKSLSAIFAGVLILLCFFSCRTDPPESKVGDASNPEVTDKIAISDLPFTENTTVNVHLMGDPGGLSPYINRGGYSTVVSERFFPTLLHIDPVSLTLSPVLAKTLPVIEEIESGAFKGMLRYTFEIHEEAVWDNGSPVQASDYAFIIKACLIPGIKTPYKPYFKEIKDFKIDPKNPKKFSVVYDKHILGEEIVGGIYFYPAYMYDPGNVLQKYTIVDLIEKNKDKKWVTEDWAKEDAGLKKVADDFTSSKYITEKDFVSSCGAYKLEEYVPNDRLVLTKKENWWGDKLRNKYPMLTAIPKKIVYKIIPDVVTALTYLKSGELDVMSAIDPEAFKQLEKTHKDKLSFHAPALLDYYYANFQTTLPKLKDKKTRKAIAHLLDLNQAQKTILKDLAVRITSPVHPSKPYYNESLKLIDYNPEKAGQLLKEAGWADSNGNGILDQTVDGNLVELEIKVIYGAAANVGRSILLLLQEAAKKQGVAIEIVGLDMNALVSSMLNKDFEMSITRAQGLPILDDFSSRWHSDSYAGRGLNFSGFGTPESDKLIEDIVVEMDENKRNSMYKRFQEILYEEQPAIFLYAPQERIAVDKKFKHVITSIRRPGYHENYFATGTK